MLAVQVESRWQVIQMLSLLALEGPKFHTRNGSRGRWALGLMSQADKCMTGVSMYLRASQACRGLCCRLEAVARCGRLFG